MTRNLDTTEIDVKYHLHKDMKTCLLVAQQRLGEPPFAPYLCRTLPPSE